jgi:hypothetical protein
VNGEARPVHFSLFAVHALASGRTLACATPSRLN